MRIVLITNPRNVFLLKRFEMFSFKSLLLSLYLKTNSLALDIIQI